MKSLSPKTTEHFNKQSFCLSLATALRHPEIDTGSKAKADVDLYDSGTLTIPQGAICRVTGRTTYFAQMTIEGDEQSDTYMVPMYTLHAYQVGAQ